MSAARQWRSLGRPVVGCIGADVPVELLSAAGALAVRLGGRSGTETPLADRYLGRGIDPATRSVLQRILMRDFGELDGLVVSRDCEASARLFYALRELRRVEPDVHLPPVHLVDVLHLPHRTTTRYVLAKLVEFRRVLESWVDHPISDTAVAEAIEAHDRLRSLLSEFAALRESDTVRLSGTNALAVVGAITSLPVHDAIELVGRAVTESASFPAVTGARAFLTGSGHDSTEVYSELENGGWLITGEDHDWGTSFFRARVGEPTLLALAERYQHNGPSAPRASIRRRAAHTAAAARQAGAAGLISYVRARDNAPPWDFAAQQRATGLPAILLEQQPYGGLTDRARASLAELRTMKVE